MNVANVASNWVQQLNEKMDIEQPTEGLPKDYKSMKRASLRSKRNPYQITVDDTSDEKIETVYVDLNDFNTTTNESQRDK